MTDARAALRTDMQDDADGYVFCRAPGRINIIGEHTDYNGGQVLPTTTGLYTWFAIRPRDDRRLCVRALNFSEMREISLDEPRQQQGWLAYVAGVAAELAAAGAAISGADVIVSGDVPMGGGLSSSASFEVGLAIGLLRISGMTMDPLAVAEACQRAENAYAGVQCGIMDQLAVAACEYGKAMLIDCKQHSWRHVAIPDECAFVVADCGFRHQLADSGYNERAAECEMAARQLQSVLPDVADLCDVSVADLEAHSDVLEPLILRRARHVVTENRRVTDAVSALQQNDLQAIGKEINASHESLRDDFDVSSDAVERLRSVMLDARGVHGARMVGGGFGGCVVAIAQAADTDAIVAHIESNYRISEGAKTWVHVVTPADPAGQVATL